MKVIRFSVDEGLLRGLNNLSKRQRKSRSEVIRQACRHYLQELKEEELDRQYREGYKRIPEEPGMGEAGLAMLAEILPKESW